MSLMNNFHVDKNNIIDEEEEILYIKELDSR
jgi:hypothetical protein